MRKKTYQTNKYTTLFITAFASFITPFLGSSINVALPEIGEHFKMGAVTLSWVTTIYLLSAAVFLIPFGKLADIYGRKKVFLYGVSVVSISSLLAVFTQSTFIFMAFRVFQGFGSAMIFGTAIAIITSVFPKHERGKAMGINVASVYVGLTLGPFLGGILTNHFGWESIFLVIAPLGIIVVLLSLAALKQEWAEAKNERFDWQGSIVYGISLSMFMYGLSVIPDWNGFVFIALGITGIFLFTKIEIHKSMPVFNMDLFLKNKLFTYSSITALINYSATFGIMFLMSLFLQYVKGMNPQEAGQVLAIQPVMMALVSPFAGRLSDKIDPGIVATIGLIILTAGLATFTTLGSSTSIIFIGFVLAFYGLGYALFSSPNTNSIMSSVEKKYYGVASGTVGTMRLIGQLVSMGVVMLLFSLIIGQVEITKENQTEFIDSAQISFIIFAMLGLLGTILSALRIQNFRFRIFKRNS
jgi:EmrB/QacA subfamily drug resistance transporter